MIADSEVDDIIVFAGSSVLSSGASLGISIISGIHDFIVSFRASSRF